MANNGNQDVGAAAILTPSLDGDPVEYTISGTSAVNSTAFAPGSYSFVANTDCFVLQAETPTATADWDVCHFVRAYERVFFAVTGAAATQKLAVIQSSASGSGQVVPLLG